MSDSYLTHLSRIELSERARYLVENLTTLSLNGKIGLLNIKDEPAYSLMQKFTHVLQEFVVRKEGFEPMFLKDAMVPKPMTEKNLKLNQLNKLALSKKPHLIKFGNREYLEKYSFKISLASSFNDPSLNSAQMDDEMKAVYTPHPSEVKISKLDGTVINGVKNIKLTNWSLIMYTV